MAQCLWTAYKNYIEYLGLHVLPEEFERYREFKSAGQEFSLPTWGGIARWIIWGLASWRDLDTLTEHDIWTREHYLADATPAQARIINCSYFGWKGITLAPAVYCNLDTQHAIFAEEIPEGNIVLAIQITTRDHWIYEGKMALDGVLYEEHPKFTRWIGEKPKGE